MSSQSLLSSPISDSTECKEPENTPDRHQSGFPFYEDKENEDQEDEDEQDEGEQDEDEQDADDEAEDDDSETTDLGTENNTSQNTTERYSSRPLRRLLPKPPASSSNRLIYAQSTMSSIYPTHTQKQNAQRLG